MNRFKSPIFLLSLILLCNVFAYTANATATEVNTTEIVDEQSDRFSLLRQYSVVFGITVRSSPDVVSETCNAHLQEFQRAVLLRKPWAMKMFDASGAVPSGFIYGNNYWLGSRETCGGAANGINIKVTESVPHKMHPQLISDRTPFPIEYRVAYILHNSTWQVDPVILFFKPYIHLGLCAPSACSVDELKLLLDAYFEEDDLFVGKRLYDMHLRVSYIKQLKVVWEILTRPSLLISVGFTLFTLVLALVAYLQRRGVERKAKQQEKEKKDGVQNKDDVAKKISDGMISGIIRCFDMQFNYSKFFQDDKVKNKNNPFFAMNGARFLSSLAVMVFHFLLCSFMVTRNNIKLFLCLRYLGNFDVFLDIFFTMGGFFYTYFCLSNEKFMNLIRRNNLVQNIQLIAVTMFHRILRLAPFYFMTLLVTDFGSKFFSELSLFHFGVQPHRQCEKYWWRNIFFIQNLFSYDEMCAFWSWSLACDMQFFIISTLLHVIYAKHPKYAKLLTLAIFAFGSGATIYFGLKYEYKFSLETVATWLSSFYINPVPRLVPHIVGVMGGWFFAQYKDRIIPMKSLNEWLGNLNLIVYFSLVFVPVDLNHSVLFSIVLLLVQRIIYGISLCYLLMSNACGTVRWFFGIFETAIFQKFSQASYGNYLLHPLVIVGVAGVAGTSYYFDPLTLFTQLLAVIFVLILSSTIGTLLFDMPYRNISRLLMQSTKEKLT